MRSHRPPQSRIVMPSIGLAGTSCRRGRVTGVEVSVGGPGRRTNACPPGRILPAPTRATCGMCGYLVVPAAIPGLAAYLEAGQSWLMDTRVKAFVQETANRLDFLHEEYGFTGPEAVPEEADVYPLLRRVRYERADLAVEISLVLSYMGEEYVAAHLVSEDDSGSVRRTEVGSSTAHTGYQMRRALDQQAEAVRRVLRGQTPPSPN